MFWRGVASTSSDRKALLDITKGHSKVADIVEMIWGDPSDPAPSAYVSPLEMCAWKYIIYTEGISPELVLTGNRTLLQWQT